MKRIHPMHSRSYLYYQRRRQERWALIRQLIYLLAIFALFVIAGTLDCPV